MKNRYRRIASISLLLLFVLIGTFACDKDKPTNPTPTTPSGYITGTVYGPGKALISGVTVKVGTLSTITDAYGLYLLSGVPLGANVKVDFEKTGLVAVQKTTAVENGKTATLDCTMFSPAITNFASTTANTIYDGGAEVQLSANAFVDENGNPFTGTVKAELKYFDPTNSDCLNAFPGTFTGLLADGVTETAFESYGFLSAKFFDAAKSDSELNLASGQTAILKAPIPWTLQAEAPATIPMWYYDEAAGKWKEQGSATKVGSYYEGPVSHFTYWNFDQPITISNEATLQGYVKWTSETGDPVVGAQLVATGVNYSGYTRVYTDAQGFFTVNVKANAQVKLRAYLGQNSTSANPPTITTPAGGENNYVSTLIMTDDSFVLNGRILNSDNTPLVDTWGYINKSGTNESYGSFQTNAEGYFTTRIYPPSAKETVSVIFSYGWNENKKFSTAINFNEPAIGQVYTIINPIVLGEGGKITAICKDTSGNLITDTYVNFFQEGGGMQGEMFAQVDANGRFTIAEAPNYTINGVSASTYFNSTQYRSQNLLNLNFPGAGQTTDMGIFVFVEVSNDK